MFPSLYADFLTTSSNAFISKRKDFFCIFYCISEMCMKFTTFWEKKRVSYPNYYRNYCIRKRCLLKRLKGLGSEHHVNGLETLLKLARHNYFPTFPRTRDKLSWKMSALVTSQIFRRFVNTLTPDDKYSHRNMQIFWQQLQTPLSQEE